MNQRTTPAPVKGPESLSKLGGTDNTKPQVNFKPKRWLNGKNRLLILEQIAERWAAKGLYQSPSRAMAILLGVSE